MKTSIADIKINESTAFVIQALSGDIWSDLFLFSTESLAKSEKGRLQEITTSVKFRIVKRLTTVLDYPLE